MTYEAMETVSSARKIMRRLTARHPHEAAVTVRRSTTSSPGHARKLREWRVKSSTKIEVTRNTMRRTLPKPSGPPCR
jgi:hypothetical protein